MNIHLLLCRTCCSYRDQNTGKATNTPITSRAVLVSEISVSVYTPFAFSSQCDWHGTRDDIFVRNAYLKIKHRDLKQILWTYYDVGIDNRFFRKRFPLVFWRTVNFLLTKMQPNVLAMTLCSGFVLTYVFFPDTNIAAACKTHYSYLCLRVIRGYL